MDWVAHMSRHVDRADPGGEADPQIDALKRASKASIKDLQSIIGRLLWLTGAWHHLRPLLIPLYKALSQIPTTMVRVSPLVFPQLVGLIDDDLFLLQSMKAQHHTLVKRCSNHAGRKHLCD